MRTFDRSLSSLRVRLCLVIALGAIPAVGVLVFNAVAARGARERAVLDELTRLNQLTVRSAEESFDNARTVLTLLAERPEERGGAGCGGRLEALRDRLGVYSNWGYATRAGKIICSARPVPEGGLAGHAWFQEAIARGRFTVGTSLRSDPRGRPVIVFATVDDTDRQAVVFAILSFEALNEALGDLPLPPGGVIHIVNASGRILLRRPEPERWVGQPFPREPFDLAMATRAGRVEGPGVDGVDRLWVIRTVPGSSETLFVAAGVASADALAAVDQHSRRNLIGIALVVILALASAWLGAGALIVRPARRIVDTARRMASGDLHARTHLSDRQGELGQIGATLDSMAAALDTRSRQAEQTLKEIEVISELAGWISATLDLPTVLGAITEAARELTAADISLVALSERPADEADKEPSVVVVRQRSGLRADRGADHRVQPGQGAGGLVLLTGVPFRTDDYRNDPRITHDFVAAVEAEDVRTLLIVPVLRAGRVDGLIYVARRTPQPFTDHDEAVLARMATYAAVAVGNAHLFEEAERSRMRLQGLSRRLLEIQEAERRELARELHDHVGQLLTALSINLEQLQRDPPERHTAAESAAIVHRLIDEVRSLSFRLRPAILDDMGLLESIRWYVAKEAERLGIEASVSVDPDIGRLPAATETAVFRIVQEATTNVARHARAQSLSVELRRDERTLQLVVSDDGVGFDPEAARRRASLGLVGMEERVSLLGGTLEIESVPGHGTEIRAQIPLAAVPVTVNGRPRVP